MVVSWVQSLVEEAYDEKASVKTGNTVQPMRVAGLLLGKYNALFQPLGCLTPNRLEGDMSSNPLPGREQLTAKIRFLASKNRDGLMDR